VVCWHPRASALAFASFALGVGATLTACGTAADGAHQRSSAAVGLAPPCAPQAVQALARAAALPPRAIDTVAFTASGGEASCRFTTRSPDGRGLDVVAELDSAPQAFYRLEREAVEYAQNVLWAHEGEASYPRQVQHLGLDADWFPAGHQLATTDGVRLITIVFVAGSRATPAPERICTSLARVYLGPLIPPHG
jgi:hypothetical protein